MTERILSKFVTESLHYMLLAAFNS